MTDEQYEGIIEAIENQDKSCKEKKYTNKDFYINGKINQNGNLEQINNFTSTQFIKIPSNIEYIVITNYTVSSSQYICEYNIYKEKLKCTSIGQAGTYTITTEPDTKYIRSSKRIDGNETIKYIDCNNTAEIIETNLIPIGTFIIGLLLVAVLLLRRNSYR